MAKIIEIKKENKNDRYTELNTKNINNKQKIQKQINEGYF